MFHIPRLPSVVALPVQVPLTLIFVAIFAFRTPVHSLHVFALVAIAMVHTNITMMHTIMKVRHYKIVCVVFIESMMNVEAVFYEALTYIFSLIEFMNKTQI